MLQSEVIEVLEALRSAGCRTWVAGGWGVDALAGHQTRPHRDLDLAVGAADEATVVAVLQRCGYRVETDHRPVRVELARAGVGWVDLHPVIFDAAGAGRQAGPDGSHFDYPPSAFVVGSLDGTSIPCLSAEQQVAFHRGYEPRSVDHHDLAVLADLSRPGTVLRPLRAGDLDQVGVVQEEGSVEALAHLFPQQTHPYPRDALRARWEHELDDPAVDCFVVVVDGVVLGFAATRGAELLHFGTARSTWGSGLARQAHDEVVGHLRSQGFDCARLWVFEANHHARHFYERRGWSPDGARTASTFAPYPVLLGYTRDLAA